MQPPHSHFQSPEQELPPPWQPLGSPLRRPPPQHNKYLHIKLLCILGIHHIHLVSSLIADLHTPLLHCGAHKTNSPNWSIIASAYMCYVHLCMQLCRSLNAKEPSVSQCQLLYWRPVSGGYVWYLLTIPTISRSFYAHFMHIFMQTKILTIEG